MVWNNISPKINFDYFFFFFFFLGILIQVFSIEVLRIQFYFILLNWVISTLIHNVINFGFIVHSCIKVVARLWIWVSQDFFVVFPQVKNFFWFIFSNFQVYCPWALFFSSSSSSSWALNFLFHFLDLWYSLSRSGVPFLVVITLFDFW